jgi:hypothetical protein
MISNLIPNKKSVAYLVYDMQINTQSNGEKLEVCAACFCWKEMSELSSK